MRCTRSSGSSATTFSIVVVFVPIGYVYPSRTETAWGLTMTLTTAWLVLYAVILVQHPVPSPWLVALSLGYLLYYAGLSLHLTLRRRGRRTAGRSRSPAAARPTPEA